jgi:hypothetical protein
MLFFNYQNHKMQIQEIETSAAIKKFLDFPRKLYATDKNWVCPLDNDIEAVFNPKKNNFHNYGVITRWLLTDDNNQTIGRIAAFINHKKAYNFPQPTGGIGFYECIDDDDAAQLLFDTAKDWLKNQGMQAMDGPINFGENDNFWGLLIEGFSQPSYGMNYNFPYYKKQFEDYGFKTEYEQITNHLNLNIPFPDRFTKIATWVANKPGYTFEHFTSKKFDKYAADFMEIYNDGWQDFANFTPIKLETVKDSFNKMKAIMDPKLLWFAYIDNEPVSFVVILPDANIMLKPLNGKLNLWGKLIFLYKKWRGVNRMRAIVMGTKQKYQKHGIESAIFIKLKEYVIPKNQYDELELSWVGDFNSKMIAIHEATGAVFGKRHATMRCVF